MARMNADPAELDKFSEQAHHWWDLEGPFKSLHAVNRLRLQWIESLQPLGGLRVLDVGCGGGILAESMARAGARVLGIDLAEKALGVAELHALEAGVPGLEYRKVAVEALAAEAAGSYDLITCMEMLEHVPRPESVVRACAQLVRPGGTVVFSTINRSATSFALGIVGAEYLLGLLPRGTHEYARLIRPSELAAFCRAAGLRVQAMQGLGYNPFARRFRLEAGADVNYLLAARRPEHAERAGDSPP